MAGAESLLLLVGALLVVAGIVGTVMPAIPGAPLVFVGLLVAAWAEGFQKVGWLTLAILAVLTLLSFVVDFFASSLGAKRVGASWAALFFAAAGGEGGGGGGGGPLLGGGGSVGGAFLRPPRLPPRPLGGRRGRRARPPPQPAPGRQGGPGNLDRHAPRHRGQADAGLRDGGDLFDGVRAVGSAFASPIAGRAGEIAAGRNRRRSQRSVPGAGPNPSGRRSPRRGRSSSPTRSLPPWRRWRSRSRSGRPPGRWRP